MSGGMHGADVEALRLLAGRIDEGGRSLDGVVTVVEAVIPDPGGWNGPDAEDFRAVWGGEHAVRLRDVATALAEAAGRIRENADAQEETSDGDPAGHVAVTSGAGTSRVDGGGDAPGEPVGAGATASPGGGTAEVEIRPAAFAVVPDDAGDESGADVGRGAAGGGDGRAGSDDGADEYPPPEVDRTVEAEPPSARTPFAGVDGLEPNTAYEVDGRGTFYTDGSGRVTHVEAEYGRTGDLNWDLMEPQPDVTYVVGDEHVFVTDDAARTVAVHVEDLQLGEADRSESVQQRIGDLGGDGYDGGHLVGNAFGGGPEDLNLVPMLEEVNRGAGDTYYALETRLREELNADPPSDVELHVFPEYDGDSPVPRTITVEYAIDGEAERKEFDNG
ncbi:DNA/RNA non-specific endonuclease [Myceligenerans pegani]|uniref:DNA/RNA non-specific endonuclease n=1 Tax=Myceligenerans pegani TaxID=2776917 RepID=A0ABR9N0A5_9MICO|nr:DNA/RNA non-specific endonuclease [Myceligenerans sp. TRM 65318]MBE1877067.1 DNA/RNA non-specific endonuclease [Myceligenerans sp. TRM 65318]MBE3019338.1 DNA/RNA non-specific endonuclease [Myceligenerans sp. TRM 65318]